MENFDSEEADQFVWKLNDDCWEKVISYLDIGSQLHFAQANERICCVFENYAKRHYKHIDGEFPRYLRDGKFDQLLQIIGHNVLSYAKNWMNPSDLEDLYNNCLMGHCYRGSMLDPSFLFQDHLNSEYTKQLYEENFESIVRNCKQLEKFTFMQPALPQHMRYEIICQLPKLQHITLKTMNSWRMEFLEGLVNKQGAPLESLVLINSFLSAEELEQICKITSLKELDVNCIQVSLQHFLQLYQLEKLHVTDFNYKSEFLMEIVKGLPHLHLLNIRKSAVTADFVRLVRAWMSTNGQHRQKLRIFLPLSNIKWDGLEDKTDNQFLEISKRRWDSPSNRYR